MSVRQPTFTSQRPANERELHPLAQQQLEDATSPQGNVDVWRLLNAVSACYEASAALAHDLLSEPVKDTRVPALEAVPVTVLDEISEGLILVDRAGRVQAINKTAWVMIDLDIDRPRHVLIGEPLKACFDQLTKDDSATESTSFQRLINDPQALCDDVSHTVQVPGRSDVLLQARPIEGGGLLLVLRQDDDLSAQRRLLHIAEKEYSSLFDNAVIGIFRSSLDGKQLRANPVLARLNGYDSEDELLRAVEDIGAEWYVDPDRRETFKRELDKNGRITDFVSEIYRHKTRERIWVSENAWIVHDPSGKPLFYEGTVVDATDRIAAEEEINHLAHHDHLTGLPNRFMLLKTLREALLRPHMASSVAVHCLDLDHFKDVNDTLGHQAGDRLLVAAGKRLRASIKSTDVLARLGGDEFTILQFGVRNGADVASLAGRIVSAMQDPFMINETRVNVGVSVGVSTYKGQEPAGMLRDADIALYEAKKRGRQTYVVYTSAMGDALQERRALEDDLRTAIEDGAFELHLQPIVDGDTGKPVVYEALLRWDHPTRGKVSPAHFVPIAEESSLMMELGDWILNKTVEAAAYLPKGQRIAMNLSPLQLRDGGFVHRVQAAMDRFQITSDQLELEITETVIMSDDQRTLKALNDLREMGLRLALDDFGTGHASLSYLQRFRFDKIKIDQSFVQRMVDDPISAAVVRAVSSLGQDLGAAVVAEGVETEEQRQALEREGCHLFQGYLFGRPAAWDEVLDTGRSRLSQ